MARRSFVGSNRVRTPRRQTEWGLGPGGSAITSQSAGAAIFLGSVIIPVTVGLTIVRIRGELMSWLSLATTSNDGFTGAFGIGIATAAATAAGPASVPTPITEADSDNWLYHQFFSVKSPVAFAAGAAQEGPSSISSFRSQVDSKAMRKFPAEMAIYAIVETAEVGTATVHFQFDSRMLLKLS